MAERILFSVCRTCNVNIISNNYPLDLFGEKTIRERIIQDLEEFSGLRISGEDKTRSPTPWSTLLEYPKNTISNEYFWLQNI